MTPDPSANTRPAGFSQGFGAMWLNSLLCLGPSLDQQPANQTLNPLAKNYLYEHPQLSVLRSHGYPGLHPSLRSLPSAPPASVRCNQTSPCHAQGTQSLKLAADCLLKSSPDTCLPGVQPWSPWVISSPCEHKQVPEILPLTQRGGPRSLTRSPRIADLSSGQIGQLSANVVA